jgi:hypothetical protein
MSTVAAARADWGKRSVLISAPADASRADAGEIKRRRDIGPSHDDVELAPLSRD